MVAEDIQLMAEGLRHSKLILRKLEPSDLPYLYQWENDAAAWSDGATHNPLSQQDLRDYIASTTGDIYRDGQLRLIAQDEELTIGCADLFDLDPRNRKAAIGLYVAPEYRGQGYSEDIMQLLEEYAFTHLNLRLLYAIIRTDNAPCTALYEKCAYVPSSPLRNWTLEADAILWQKTKQ